MKLRTILLILAFISIVSVSIGGYLYYVSLNESALERAHQEAMIQTQFIADHIDSFLLERQKTVKSFAGLKELRQALANKDETNILDANMILDQFQQSLNVDVCYLMDENGNTIASSNRNAPDSFVGKNYAFRPYFQKAKQGNPSVYMALGTTSGKRGVYFSYPVYGELSEFPSGVIVVKDSNQATEKEMSRVFEGVMLFTDPHGVIFVSSREDWLFHVLWKVSPDEIAKIEKSRQFGDGPFSWTGLKREGETRAIDKSGIEYNIHQTEIKNYPGWKVVYLHDLQGVINRISGPIIKTAGLTILILCLIFGLAILFLLKKAATVIVQRKKAEEAVLKEKDKAQKYLDIAGVIIVVLNIDQTVSLVNEKGSEILGYPVKEIIGESWFDKFIPARLRDQTKIDFESLIKDENELGQFYENPIVNKNGEERIIKWHNTVLRDTEGNIISTLSSGEDITEQKQAEKTLRESEEKFRILFESSKDANYISTREGIIVSVNQSFLNLFGYTQKELFNMKSLNTYVNSSDRSRFMAEIEKIGFVKDLEVKLRTKSGAEIDCQITATVLRTAKGDIIQYQGIIRDVTESKRRQMEREKLIFELQAALAEVKTLSGLLPICSHCKKIRDDKGYWSQIEAYIGDRSEAVFSHSICQECAKEFYPDMDIYDESGEVTQE